MNPPATEPPGPSPSEFDQVAENYDAELMQALSATGESKDYFAAGRVAFLRDLLPLDAKESVRRIVDFGCGTGSATPHLTRAFGPSFICGVDVSLKSIEVAARHYGGDSVVFEDLRQSQRKAEFDLAFTNGVFHHIPPSERSQSVQWVFNSLRPGGYFAFWENNPWNPGTKWTMSRCSFDANAITLSPPEARRLLRSGGFEVVRTDFLFIFPRMLRLLRWTERPLSRLPLGGQYQVLCRKP
jgi:SAM-dependent methyltransferase